MAYSFYLKSSELATLTETGERNGAYVRQKVLVYFRKEGHAKVTVIDYSIYSGMTFCQMFHKLGWTVSEEKMADLEKLREQSQKEWERRNGNGKEGE